MRIMTAITIVLAIAGGVGTAQADLSAWESWDSGWVMFPDDPPLEVWLVHDLGGDSGAYVVSLTFRGFEGTGIHDNGVGGLYDSTSGHMQGGYFSELDAHQVKITRYEDDMPVRSSPHAEFRLIILYDATVVGVVEGDVPPDTGTLQTRPNPSRGSTLLTLTLDRRLMGASLIVYDVRGRTVRTMPLATLDVGRNVLSWDGRDDQGANLPPGVYLFRIDGTEGAVARGSSVITR